jgi:hypothetical protein
MAIKYGKWPEYRPNGHKIYQHFPLLDPPKLSQIGIFGFENKPSGNPEPLFAAETRTKNWPGLPDGIFSNQKSKFGKFWRALK